MSPVRLTWKLQDKALCLMAWEQDHGDHARVETVHGQRWGALGTRDYRPDGVSYQSLSAEEVAAAREQEERDARAIFDRVCQGAVRVLHRRGEALLGCGLVAVSMTLSDAASDLGHASLGLCEALSGARDWADLSEVEPLPELAHPTSERVRAALLQAQAAARTAGANVLRVTAGSLAGLGLAPDPGLEALDGYDGARVRLFAALGLPDCGQTVRDRRRAPWRLIEHGDRRTVVWSTQSGPLHKSTDLAWTHPGPEAPQGSGAAPWRRDLGPLVALAGLGERGKDEVLLYEAARELGRETCRGVCCVGGGRR